MSAKYIYDVKYLARLIGKVHPLKDKLSITWYEHVKQYVDKITKIHNYNHFYFTINYILNGFQDAHIIDQLNENRLTQPYIFPIFAKYDYKKLVVVESKIKKIPVGSIITKVNNILVKKYLNTMCYSFGGVEDVPIYMIVNSLKMFMYFEYQNHSMIKTITLGNKKKIDINYKQVTNYKKRLNKAYKKYFPEYYTVNRKFEICRNDKQLRLVIPTFQLKNKNDLNIYNEMLNLLQHRSNDFKKIIIDLRGNGGGHGKIMKRLSYVLYGRPKPYKTRQYQKISPEIFKEWKEDIIDGYITKVFGKNSNIYKEEVKTLRKWKNMYRNGKRMDITTEIMNNGLDEFKPDKIYKGKLEIIINEKCGSATLMFLDIVHKIKNVELCGTTTLVDTPYHNPLEFALLKTKAKVNIVTVYHERKPERKYNKFYEGVKC